MKEIITAPNEILKKRCEDVKNFGDLKTVVNEIKEVLTSQPAAGLAAPQIGYSIRVFGISRLGGEPEFFVNPVFYSPKKPIITYEGCLSIPGKTIRVQRFFEIQVTYQTISGQKLRKKLTGVDAYVFQHEFDHLNGILITDKEVKN